MKETSSKADISEKINKVLKDAEEIAKDVEKNAKEQMAYFADTTDSFIKVVSWGLAISAGTLLWIMGSFDKFIINNCPDTCNSFIPSKLYFLLIESRRM
jgi:hypothetical protein